MLSRNPRRLVAVLVVLVGLAVFTPAHALQPRQRPSVLASPERLVEVFRGWLADLWSGYLRKNGATTDPDGQTAPGGAPDGAATGPETRNDNGMSIDPNG